MIIIMNIAYFSGHMWHKFLPGGGGFSLHTGYADVPLDRYGLTKNCLT